MLKGERRRCKSRVEREGKHKEGKREVDLVRRRRRKAEMLLVLVYVHPFK